jgi:hypothetical protein
MMVDFGNIPVVCKKISGHTTMSLNFGAANLAGAWTPRRSEPLRDVRVVALHPLDVRLGVLEAIL